MRRSASTSLNGQYGDDTFYLFHRPRRWNAGERVWMGYERKRGKLADLNWLLRERTRRSRRPSDSRWSSATSRHWRTRAT